jgi:hypothetical protein
MPHANLIFLRRIVLSPVACLAAEYFPHQTYQINGMIFGKDIECKMCSDFVTVFLKHF